MTQPEKDHTITKVEKVLYTAKAHTTGGRDGGASRTSDGRLDVKLSVPGTAGTGTNPEQLFAVGWSACFLSAINTRQHQRSDQRRNQTCRSCCVIVL